MITLKTLSEATEQEVFDQVAEHLLKQNLCSVDDQSICQYRGPSGLKCAAGCLIADDEYQPYFEGFSWLELYYLGHAQKHHLNLIRKLQEIHDGVSTERWRNRLKALAETYELEWKFN